MTGRTTLYVCQAPMDVVFNLAHAPAAGAHAVQGRRLRRRQGCSAQPCRPARRSPPALAKDATKYTPGGQPVHSLATLLDDLATIAANRTPAAGLRAPWRLPPPRARAVRRHQNAARFRRQAPCPVPNEGKFGLAPSGGLQGSDVVRAALRLGDHAALPRPVIWHSGHSTRHLRRAVADDR